MRLNRPLLILSLLLQFEVARATGGAGLPVRWLISALENGTGTGKLEPAGPDCEAEAGRAGGQRKWTARDAEISKLFCENAHLAVCGFHEDQRVDSENTLRRISVDLRMRELPRILREYGAAGESQESLKDRAQAASLKRVLARASGLEEGRVRGELEAVREELEAAIRAAPELSPERRDKYRSRIRAVRWVTAADFLKLRGRGGGKNALEEIQEELVSQACGPDGLAINAFYFHNSDANWDHEAGGWDVGDQQRMLICPGLLLAMNLKDSNSQLGIRALMASIIGHELGHSIDSQYDFEGYQKHLVCLAGQPEAEELEGRPGDPEDEAGHSLVPVGKRISNHSREIIGDQWGARAMGRMLRQGHLGNTPTQMLASLSAGLSLFCEASGTDGTHPDSFYRVNQVFGANPDIRKAMGCLDAGVSPAPHGVNACPL
jgi:hypothetical protein